MQKAVACILCLLVGISTSAAPLVASAKAANDPLLDDQWYLDRVDVQKAWKTTTGSRDIIVAVLDSGVDLLHRDLEDNIWENVREIPEDGIDNDRNGYIDDKWGYDFVLDEGNPFPVIAAGNQIDAVSVLHGTLVSGIVGALGDNSRGVAGVAWAVQIMPIRVLDEDGNGRGDKIADGIRYAVDQGASVINLSFSGTGSDAYVKEALRYANEKGVVVVGALGNEGKNVNDESVFPACSGIEEYDDLVIGVAASDELDERADFSNYGSDCVDITAPGTDVTGIAYYNPEHGFEDEYTLGWSGTSLSTPIVSGAAALLLAEYPELTPQEIQTIIQISADPVEGVDRADMGSGRLNIGNAFEKADELWQQLEDDRLSALEFIKTADSSTVYMLMPDGARRLVLDAQTFFTYMDSFDQVRTISKEEMGGYKLRGTVLPRANRVLVKIVSDPKVYWLARSGNDPFTPTLREVPSEEVAVALFGSEWNSYVIDVDIAMFEKFNRGRPVGEDEQLQTRNLKKQR